MPLSFELLAYFGPETVLPVTSVIATVVGGALMVGRAVFSLAVRDAGAGRRSLFRAEEPVPRSGLAPQDQVSEASRP